ncbi:MAG: hypothetical protein IKZ59_00035 [Clostridia bacterium]|nr:hypothetical protein [Clostridia bacterium]
MKRLIALLCAALLLLLTGCDSAKTTKAGKPYSSTIETGTDDPVDDPTDDETERPYEISGGDDAMLSFLDDDEDAVTTSLVEKGTSPATLDTKWRTDTYSPVEPGGAEALAVTMRNNVINSPNTAEIYHWTGKTYYVSPDGDDEKNDGLSPSRPVKTLDADIFATNPTKPGDAILFERGGVWRMTSSIRGREGVIYGSYGTGQKPTFYGSAANYADEKYWLATKKKNIWKITITESDVGQVVFNHGELVGYKKFNGLTTLEKNGDYFFNSGNDSLYVYFDGGNPGKYYDDIEISLRIEAFLISKDHVTVDNLRFKYFSRGGVYTGSCTNYCTITNCEIGFIGGALHHDTVRLGNCIQNWNTSKGMVVRNNWMYQAYDTGYTFQGNDKDAPGYDEDGNPHIGDNVYYEDITVRDNIIEYCCYAIEFWHGNQSNTEPCLANIINFDLSDNCFRYSGYSWSHYQRHSNVGYNIYVGSRKFKNAVNCKITGNTFDLSNRSTVYWSYPGEQYGFEISGNTFYHAKNERSEGMWYGRNRDTYDQASLESAVATFDKNPRKVQWLEK